MQALNRINVAIATLVRAETEPELTIEKITHSSPLDISLAGFIPETIEALRQIQKDREYRNAHEKKMAELEEAKTDAENRMKELELKAMMLEQIKNILDMIAPTATPQQRLVIAAQMMPDFQLLMSSKVVLSLDEPDAPSPLDPQA